MLLSVRHEVVRCYSHEGHPLFHQASHLLDGNRSVAALLEIFHKLKVFTIHVLGFYLWLDSVRTLLG